MTSAVPARKIDTIMSELNRLLEKCEVDAFQLRRVEGETERLWEAKAISPSEYYVAKAFFAIGRQQRENALYAAKNALRLAPNDPIVQLNVLTVFVGILDIEASLPLMRSMAANQRDNKEIVKSLIIKAADLMQLQLANELFEVFDALSVNDPPAVFFRRGSCEQSLDAMSKYQLTDDDLAERIKAAAGALRSASLDVFRNSRRTLSDGSVIYCMHVNADVDKCAEMNFRIADALVEKFDDPCGEFISFFCRPLSDLEEMQVVPGGRL